MLCGRLQRVFTAWWLVAVVVAMAWWFPLMSRARQSQSASCRLLSLMYDISHRVVAPAGRDVIISPPPSHVGGPWFGYFCENMKITHDRERDCQRGPGETCVSAGSVLSCEVTGHGSSLTWAIFLFLSHFIFTSKWIFCSSAWSVRISSV